MTAIASKPMFTGYRGSPQWLGRIDCCGVVASGFAALGQHLAVPIADVARAEPDALLQWLQTANVHLSRSEPRPRAPAPLRRLQISGAATPCGRKGSKRAADRSDCAA